MAVRAETVLVSDPVAAFDEDAALGWGEFAVNLIQQLLRTGPPPSEWLVVLLVGAIAILGLSVGARRLRRWNAKLPAKLLDALPVGVLFIDREGNLAQASRSVAEQFAQNVDDLLGRPAPEALESLFAGGRLRHEEGGSLTGRAGVQLVPERLDGASFEIPNGRTLALSVHVFETGTLLSALDVTANRRQAQRFLDVRRRLLERSSEARQLAIVAEHTQDMILLLGEDGEILWWNAAFEQESGFDANVLQGGHLSLQFGATTDVVASEALMEAARLGRAHLAELELERADHSPYWSEVTLSPVPEDHTAQGKRPRLVCIQRDVSERRQHLARLAESETSARAHAERAEAASQAKSRFLNVLSHELRTPLNGLMGTTELLLEGHLAPLQRRLVETLLESGEAMLAAVSDLVDYVALEQGNALRADVASDPCAVLEELVALMRPAADRRIVVLELDLPIDRARGVALDRAKLRKIVLGLMTDALKRTDGGAVTLRLRVTRQPGQEPGEVEVSVEDDGMPLAAPILDALSKASATQVPDITAEADVLGLSLAVNRMLAQGSGGSLMLRRRQEGGMRAILRLPATRSESLSRPKTEAALEEVAPPRQLPVPTSPAQPAPPTSLPEPHEEVEAPAAKDAAPRSEKQDSGDNPSSVVLVVDDNATNRLVASHLLRRQGCRVLEADSGAAALDVFIAEAPDLVLMDLSMPGMNGFEATRRLRAIEAERSLERSPIVALTANALPEHREACREAGMDGFLTKPIRVDEIVAILNGKLSELPGAAA
ncbi:MAG: response regulator [Pseudomonadota bacterium]